MPHTGTAAPTRAAIADEPDAYSTTGTSPTAVRHDDAARHRSVREVRRRYDTVHLVGPGAVGSALLERLAADRRRLTAVTDSTATLYHPAGIDARAVIAWKRAGRSLCEHPLALRIDSVDAVAHVDAAIVADCTPTVLGRPSWTQALGAALARGACVASAAKAAVCEAGAEWLSGDHHTRVGCNAVLGGTGRSFIAELPELRRRCCGIAIAGNASTTAIVTVIEQGGTLEDGVIEAGRLGYLEPDPELDLRGTDAALKLAIVAGIITGRRIDPRTIPCEDIRSVDPLLIRARARRNATTRLIGRMGAAGELRVGYEEISRDSLLAAPCGRVVYEYRLERDERRLHIGSGLGANETAGALWADIRSLAAAAASRPSGHAGVTR